MNLNFTNIIISLIFAAVIIYAIGELRPSQPVAPVQIDSAVIKQMEVLNKELSGKVDGLKTELKTYKNQRKNVYKEVQQFTDSDVIHFNDSISAIYCPTGRSK